MLARSIIYLFAAAAIGAASLTAACGGSAYGGSGYGVMPAPHPSPSQAATGSLNTATLKGSPGFVTPSGFTAYVFDLDLSTPGQSACNGECAQNWPAIHTSGTTTSPWGSIQRQDGTTQLTYQGRPLYTFIADSAPGQTNGDGLTAFGGTWHVARP